MKILVLGATGMVGRSLLRKFQTHSELQVIGTTTSQVSVENQIRFQWPADSLVNLIKNASPDVVINVAAILNHKLLDFDELARRKAFGLNSDLPLALSPIAEKIPVIHVSTDGVFSGENPPYTEVAPTDGEGVYAESKIKGEANLANGKILRCSILGRSPNTLISIPNLLLRQPKNSVMEISQNEHWNGVTSYAFAEFVASLLRNNFLDSMAKIQHVIPKSPISKIELFQEVAKAIARNDLTFIPSVSEDPRNRILTTADSDFLKAVWGSTSFGRVPTIQEMIKTSDLRGV
jgi:dTDP-4-dehydrorhamnose reductase